MRDVRPALPSDVRPASGSAGPCAERTSEVEYESVSGIYGDLTEGERAFLVAVSVFVGGFTFEGARHVSAAAGIDEVPVDDVVADLVRRSVILEAGAPKRYDLPDDVRRHALEDLQASPKYDHIREKHLDWCRSYAEQGAAALDGPGQQAWLEALESEHDNFRAALEWGTARRDCEAALGLAAALGRFWEVRSHVAEGRRWLDRALGQSPGAPPMVRARAASSAGLLAFRGRDYAAARTSYEESLALHWSVDDRLGATGILHALGNVAFQQRDLEEGRRLFGESLDIGRQLGDDRVIAASLTNLGAVAEVKGDHRSARSLYGEALDLWRTIGDSYNAASVLANLAEVALAERDLAGARALASDALEARRLVGDKAGMASVLRLLSTVALKQRDVDAARSFEAQRRQLVGETEGSWLARFRRRLAP